MRVLDVMSTPAFTVPTNARFGEVVDTLVRHDIHAVPVVDARGGLAGVISEADVVRRSGHPRALGLVADALDGTPSTWTQKAAQTTARALMTRNPRAIAPDADLATAAVALLEHHHLLPVVDLDNQVLGVVTRRDLLKRFAEDDAYIAAEIVDVLEHARRSPGGLEVQVSVVGGIVSVKGTTELPEDIPIVQHVIAQVPGVLAIRSDLAARLPSGSIRSESLAWRWRRVGAGTR